jgi:hypothetical protein
VTRSVCDQGATTASILMPTVLGLTLLSHYSATVTGVTRVHLILGDIGDRPRYASLRRPGTPIDPGQRGVLLAQAYALPTGARSEPWRFRRSIRRGP